jgi:hypothetical protein
MFNYPSTTRYFADIFRGGFGGGADVGTVIVLHEFGHQLSHITNFFHQMLVLRMRPAIRPIHSGFWTHAIDRREHEVDGITLDRCIVYCSLVRWITGDLNVGGFATIL